MRALTNLKEAHEAVMAAIQILQSNSPERTPNRPVAFTPSISPELANLIKPYQPTSIEDYVKQGGIITIHDPAGGTFTVSGETALEVIQHTNMTFDINDGQLAIGADGTWRPTFSLDADMAYELGPWLQTEATLNAEVYLEAQGSLSAAFDIEELKANFGAEGHIEIGANVQYHQDISAIGGLITGNIDAEAYAKAGIYGAAAMEIDLKNLKAHGDVSLLAKAEARAEIEANLGVLGTLAGVQVGGQAYAEAYAGIDADIVLDPSNGDFYIGGQAGAYAGAGAGGSVGVNLFGDSIQFGVQGGVAASAGAGISGVVGFQDGTFVLDWSAMAGAKAGGYVGTYAEIDVAGVADYFVDEGVDLVGGAFDVASNLLPGDLGIAVGSVGDAVTDTLNSVGGAVTDFGMDALESGMSALGKVFSGF